MLQMYNTFDARQRTVEGDVNVILSWERFLERACISIGTHYIIPVESVIAM